MDGLVIADTSQVYSLIEGENPKYSFSFKSYLTEEKVETTVINIEWNISKSGKIIPILIVDEVEIDNVKINRCTANNAKYIVNNNINIGSKVLIKRSNDVIPKIEKVILNMGLGEDASDGKKLKACVDDLSLIAGQKPVITKFKKSISNFKTRKGANSGVKVTLRSNKMYEFIDRLVNIALPRIKDFRGLSSKGIDNSNNYSFGIKEHIIFPEVNFDKVDKIRGMDITMVTTSKNKKGTLELLKEFNFPISEKKN